MKKLLTLFIIVGATLSTQAQQIPLYSNYFFTPYVYNPAYSGTDGVTEATIIHRRQWSDIQGSPETSALALNGALNNQNVGYSVYGYVDQTDILQRTGIYGNYAYHFRLSKTATISLGLGAGYLNQGIDRDAVRAQDAGDIYDVVPGNRSTFDLSAGLRVQVANFSLGASAPQLIGQDVVFSDNGANGFSVNLTRHYIFNSQYDFEFNGDDQVLSPMVMVRAGENIPVQVDAGMMFSLKEFGYVGAMYRSDYAVTGNIGVNLTDQLTLGYAHDFSLSDYGSSLGTSHEFMLTYRFGSNRDNEKLENELKRLKRRQRQQQDEVDETIDDRLKEFEDRYKEDIRKELEQQKDEQSQQQSADRNNQQQQRGNNRQDQNQQGQAVGGNNASQPNSSRGESSSQSSRNQQSGGGRTQSNDVQGYNPENQAANVNPGSKGYYVTAGVFSSEGNARKRIRQLENQGFNARSFKDSGNGFYYVYLLKFNSYQKADQAKSSRLNGAYSGDLWIKIVE